MKDIVIIGAGGFGREVAWLIEEINKEQESWKIVGFVDDDTGLQGTIINGYKVIGDIEWLKQQNLHAVSAIGNPIVKREIIDRLKGGNIKYPVLIHPSVICSERLIIGEGTLICAGSILTVDIVVGKHVIVNLDSTIGHDTDVGDFVTILPSVNISGSVRIGSCASIGTGAKIINDVSIGECSVIGAGAVVVRNVPANCTAVGVPAKPIEKLG